MNISYIRKIQSKQRQAQPYLVKDKYLDKLEVPSAKVHLLTKSALALILRVIQESGHHSRSLTHSLSYQESHTTVDFFLKPNTLYSELQKKTIVNILSFKF